MLSIDLTPGAAALGLSVSDHAAAVARQQEFHNKVSVSQHYADKSNLPGGGILVATSTTSPALRAATTVLHGVTYDPATVTAAVTGINNAVANQNLADIQQVS